MKLSVGITFNKTSYIDYFGLYQMTCGKQNTINDEGRNMSKLERERERERDLDVLGLAAL